MSSSARTHELFRACERGDRKAVEQMLSGDKGRGKRGGGIEVDEQDDDGHTALQVAAANDQVKNLNFREKDKKLFLPKAS